MITPELIERSKKVCASFYLDDRVTVYLLNGLVISGSVGEVNDSFGDTNETVLALYTQDNDLVQIDIVNNPIVAHSVKS